MAAAKHRQLNIKSLLTFIGMMAVGMIMCILLLYFHVVPAVALEQELRCGIEEHIHTDACYSGDFLTCPKQAHAHDGNCYIVLLDDNNINGILTMLDNTESRSLEYVISDVMSTALTYNDDLNRPDDTLEGEIGEGSVGETLLLSGSTVAAMNETISQEESLPDIVLNEKINTINTLSSEDMSTGNTPTIQPLAIGDDPVDDEYIANIYVYLDKKWTCIGSLEFTTARSGTRYTSSLPTADILELVNGALGTSYTYSAIDVAVSPNETTGYSVNGLGIERTTTTIGYRQTSSSVASATKYVRIITENGSASATTPAFYTVTLTYPNGVVDKSIYPSGTTITLPAGNYEWVAGDAVYAAEQQVTITDTITFVAREMTHVDIHYDVNFPTSITGVTVPTKPTLAGLTTTTVTDGVDKPSSAVIRNVSQQSVDGNVNGNTTGLSRVVQFKGWRLGDTDVILQPNTTLVWEELVQYATAGEIELNAIWEYNALQTATFFIRFDSVAVDTEGNITGQDQNKYTNELFSAYVGGVDTSLGVDTLQNRYRIADTTSDNSFGADQKIRALYGEKSEGVWLTAFPNDDYIFEELKQYANTGYLSVDGVPVKAEDLNHKAYAIRWYVFKCQSDAWHIDGKLVKKEGLIHVYKTFAGNKELIEEAKQDFYIDAHDITAGTNTTLDMTNYKTHNDVTDTYMWEITNVDYGELWEITEHPHIFSDIHVEFSTYSEYTVMDADGDQSISGSGTSLTVKGMTYALDEGTDEVLRAAFTNIYNKSDSIIIKKQDSRTGESIGGATFRLLQNGKELSFRYDDTTGSYIFDQTNGTHTVLSGTSNGYFEISIEDFSYDLGPIVIQEVTPPVGYTPIGSIEIGYTDDQKTIGILSGNSDLIRYNSGILIIGNSTESSSVIAKKAWDCPETEWQDVTVQLLANGKLVTTVVAGVAPQVVLTEENNWSHTWENLPVYVNGEKINWSIKETRIGSEQCKADGSFVNWLASYELPVHSTDEDGNEVTLLTVTNTTKRVMLRLTKTDIGKTVQLSGASFLLEVVDKDGNPQIAEVSKSATTGENGTLVFDNMKAGVRYRLTETVAPTGYLPIGEYIYFTINEDGSVAVEDSYYASAGNTAYNITVRNAPGLELPVSGGLGSGMFYAVGLLLCSLALGIGISTLRKRRCSH